VRHVFVFCNIRAEAEETVTHQETMSLGCDVTGEAEETQENRAYIIEVAAVE
jgi:hypothetical protein